MAFIASCFYQNRIGITRMGIYIFFVFPLGNKRSCDWWFESNKYILCFFFLFFPE